PDGSLFIADTGDNRILWVTPDGSVFRIAGTGQPYGGNIGNGGPATLADIYRPTQVAVGPDGSVYFNDFSFDRIRRVFPNGIITTVPSPNALDPQLPFAVGPDGSVYFTSTNILFRLKPNGSFVGFAGNSLPGSSGEGVDANSARISPDHIALGPD